jgi:N-acyl amino acid synthase of PEP-CTERM/exosortase system
MNGRHIFGGEGEGPLLRHPETAGGSIPPSHTEPRGEQILLFRRATTPPDLEKVFRLRYLVYVDERGFERAEDHPGGIERDRFDTVAVHFLCEKPDGLPMGTIRLIPPSPVGFPHQEHCQFSIDPAELPRERLCEASRLAVSQAYQRRRDDPFYLSPSAESEQVVSLPRFERRRVDIALGLYREVYRAMKAMGLTHLIVVVEEKLWIRLRRVGFDFRMIGPYVDYHGRRAPFLTDLWGIERALGPHFPEGL